MFRRCGFCSGETSSSYLLGWSAFNTLESVIVSVRANLVLGGARLMAGRQADYTEAEAKEVRTGDPSLTVSSH
jgi:hypothetical protein